MNGNRLNLQDVVGGEVFYLDPSTNLATTRTTEFLERDVYEIHQLFYQIWTDSNKVKRDFSLERAGYTALRSDEDTNRNVKICQRRRKTAQAPGPKKRLLANGCSYEDNITKGCTAEIENIFRVGLYSADAFTGIQIRHRARRLKGDDKGSLRPENGEIFIEANGTRDKLDRIIMNEIEKVRKLVKNEEIPLPMSTKKKVVGKIPPYVAKSTRRRLYCPRKDCVFVTIYARDLKDHEDKHDGVKRYGCDLCNKKFATQWYMKQHVKKGCEDRRKTEKKTPIRDMSAKRLSLRELDDMPSSSKRPALLDIRNQPNQS